MRIFQVLDALDYGDGVSNDVIAKMHLLKSRGYETEIYSKYVHENVRDFSNAIETMCVEQDDIVIHHFSGKSIIMDDVLRLKCRKVLVYHNITPPKYFGESFELAEGLDQIKRNRNYYDYFVGDSQFNIDDLCKLGVKGEIDLLPILIDFEKFKYVNKKNDGITKFLFVGRIAPNKKIEDVIDVFEYYYTNCDSRSRLKLVGNYTPYIEYYQALLEKLDGLKCKENVLFTGKVSEDELCDEYYDADVFLCMSEHEGFCLPLLESMHCGNITIAYDACAVKETMGEAGILISHKNAELISKLIFCIMTNKPVKDKIINKQLEYVKKYSKDEICKRLEQLIEKWRV